MFDAVYVGCVWMVASFIGIGVGLIFGYGLGERVGYEKARSAIKRIKNRYVRSNTGRTERIRLVD